MVIKTIVQNEDNVSAEERAALDSFKTRHPMELLLKSSSLVAPPKAGDIVDGTVMNKDGTWLYIDLGSHGTGVVYGKEYYAAQEIIKNLNAGDAISAKVVESDNEDGYVELSLKEAGEEKRWTDIKRMVREGEVLELPVLEANRGGLILEAFGIKGFLPSSQLSSQHYPRVEGGDKERIYQELQKLVGQSIKIKILDVNPAERKLIFTEKGQQSESLRTAAAKYKIGDEVEGEITGVVDFGAFMKFDEAGLEGLIHISEIDWLLVDDPRSILKPGDKVKAKIIDIQGDKISLSLKQLKEDPWLKVSEKYHKGDTVHGKVTKFNPFGAFVELESGASNGIQGLLHISEFGTEAKMREELELLKAYEFKILMVDAKDHKMSLGIMRENFEVKKEENRN
jgi:small subunit ribosomal protein S1